jgi:hypothetical protein
VSETLQHVGAFILGFVIGGPLLVCCVFVVKMAAKALDHVLKM